MTSALAVIGSSLNADRILRGEIPGLSEPDAVFATESWTIKTRLEAKGRRALILDRFVELEECLRLDREGERIRTEWFRPGGRDFTELAGISLGELCEFELTFPIVHLLKCVGFAEKAFASLEPASVFTDLPGAHPGRRVLESAARARQVPLRLLPPDSEVRPASWVEHRVEPGSLWKSLSLRLLNALARVAGPDAPGAKKVLCVTYIVMNPVYRAWCGRAGRLSLRLSPFPTPSKADILKMSLNGVRSIAPPINPRPSPQLRRRLESLRSSWTSLKRDPAYRDGYRYGGVPLFDILEPSFDRTIEQMIALAPLVEHFSSSLDRDPVDAVLVPTDIAWQARLFALLARRRGIPAIELQHGFSAFPWLKEMTAVDHALVWGETAVRDFLRDRPNVRKALTVGNPNWDAYRDATPGPSGPRTPGTPMTILALSHGFGPASTGESTADPELYLDLLFKAFQKLGFPYRIIFRTYAADDPAYFRSLVERFPEVPVEHDRFGRTSFRRRLEESDVLVTGLSSGLFEAWILGKPFVYVKPTRMPCFPPFDGGPEIPHAAGPEELTRLLTDLHEGRLQPEPWRDREALARYIGPVDGRSAGRVLETIEKILAPEAIHA